MTKNLGVYIFWTVFAILLLFRFIFSIWNEKEYSLSCVGSSIKGKGYVVSEPEEKETGQVFVLNPDTEMLDDDCNINSNIRIKTDLFPRYDYGDYIEYSGKLSKPYNFGSKDGRKFNYEGYLAKDDIYFEIKSADIRLIHDDGYTSLQSLLFDIKNSFIDNIENVLGEPHSALATGLVVGEKSALGKELLNDFRIVGLIHIIVLSGFNITIVGEALRRVLSFLPRIWGIVIGGLGISLFGILVGGGATVVRSCFMAIVALSADFARRDYSVLRALLFAGMIMLIINPRILLYDPSFQLSFLATLGLILLAGKIENWLSFITESFGIRGILASTLATQIFVSPFILYTMGQISIIGIVVNLLVLPLIPMTMLSVFLTGLSGWIFYPASQFFGWLSHLLLSYELFVVKVFSKIPYASFDVPIFSVWWVVGFYLLFIILTIVYKRCSLLIRKQNSKIIDL